VRRTGPGAVAEEVLATSSDPRHAVWWCSSAGSSIQAGVVDPATTLLCSGPVIERGAARRPRTRAGLTVTSIYQRAFQASPSFAATIDAKGPVGAFGCRSSPEQPGHWIGFLIDNNGHIITTLTSSRVRKTVFFPVQLGDGAEQNAQVVGAEPLQQDIALLKVDNTEGSRPLPWAQLSKSRSATRSVASGNTSRIDRTGPTGIVPHVQRLRSRPPNGSDQRT